MYDEDDDDDDDGDDVHVDIYDDVQSFNASLVSSCDYLA